MSRIGRHVFVQGRVQGVAFRWCARERAAELGVSGWIRNLADGRVEARLEGEAGAVRSMVDWLREGPPAARVSAVDEREREPEDLDSFDVLSSGFG